MIKHQSLAVRLLLDQGRQHVVGYLIAFAFMGLAAGATGAAAYIMGDIINKIFVGRDPSVVYGIAATVVAVYLVKGIGAYGQEVVLAKIGNRIVAAIQTRMFDHILAQSPAYYNDRHSTEFIAQLSFMANGARAALNLMVTAIGRDALTLLMLGGVMVIQDPPLAIGAMISLPLVVFIVRRLIKRARKIMENEFTGFSIIMETVQEAVRGIQIVKAFELMPMMQDRMNAAVTSFEKAATRLAMVAARTSPLMETLGGLTIAAIIVYGGWRVTTVGATPGQFFSFITAFLLAYEPAKRLARLNVDLGAAMVGVRMLYGFLDAPAAETEPDPRPDLKVGAGAVKAEGLTFAYRAAEPVLNGFGFEAAPGRVTALIGPSGSGKSTIFALLQGFYPLQGGRILIDGQDISAVNRRSLRRAMAVVSQDAFLFKGTIRDNIGFGRPGASEAEIIAAAKAAQADSFITGFSRGYDTQVGEDGASLSGGQRQRIAIARALLKDAPIILLDEATSALDLESERLVRQGLATLSEGRTVILIAHRTETYAHADTVITMPQRGAPPRPTLAAAG